MIMIQVAYNEEQQQRQTCSLLVVLNDALGKMSEDQFHPVAM